jgi:DNA-binding GntR family transcriptional regulator
MQFVSKTDMVAAALHELIITGEFESGARLRQRELASRFGVSLTPVREALRRLQSEGLIQYDVHRGATVTGTIFTPTEENFQVRAALEPLAAGLAATRITSEEIAELRQINDELRTRTERDEAAQELNRRFHFVLYEAARSPLLLALLRLLWRSLTPRINRPLAVSVSQHDEMLAALERRSREETERSVRNHILTLLEYRISAEGGSEPIPRAESTGRS